MPPLRKRVEDIPLLVSQFLHKFNGENATAVEAFSSEAMMHLLSYPWPGNVRELENVVERCVVMADHNTSIVDAALLPSVIRDGSMRA